ncbi:unnamed protein product [Phaeothamnion confervicola]
MTRAEWDAFFLHSVDRATAGGTNADAPGSRQAAAAAAAAGAAASASKPRSRWGFFCGAAPLPEEGEAARSNAVTDYLRNGRMLLRREEGNESAAAAAAGQAGRAEAEAVRRLHATLVRGFEELELDDDAVWGRMVFDLRGPAAAASDGDGVGSGGGGGGRESAGTGYAVRAHRSGLTLCLPLDFTDRGLRTFLGRVLLATS